MTGRIVVVDDSVNPPVTSAQAVAASTGKVGELFGERTWAGIAGLLDSCPFPGRAADRCVFPVRIPQHA